MFKSNRVRRISGAGLRLAIVASEYNRRYVDSMLKEARSVLKRSGAEAIEVVRVPGAFEIPAVAAALAVRDEGRPSAILCLGVILRGETTHAQHIAEAVSHGLTRIQIEFRLPVIHEVLLLENEDQAKARCLGERGNRGGEAAYTALKMARVMKEVSRSNRGR